MMPAMLDAATPVVVRNNPLAGGGRSSRAAAPAPADADAELSFIRCSDAARGLTYYANVLTGETVWTLPPGGVVTQLMSR